MMCFMIHYDVFYDVIISYMCQGMKQTNISGPAPVGEATELHWSRYIFPAVVGVACAYKYFYLN